MIVEYAGLPGSGKSTLETRVTAGLEARGWNVIGRKELEYRYASRQSLPYGWVERLGRYGFYLHAWMRYTRRSMAAGYPLRSFHRFKGGPGYWAEKDALLSAYYVSCIDVHRPQARELYCPSEGLLQHLAGSAIWFEPNVRDLSPLMAVFPFHKLNVVRTRVDAEVAFARFIARGVPDTWPPSVKSERLLREVYFCYEEVITNLVKEFVERGATVIDIDTSCSISELERHATGICNQLEQIVAPGSSQ